MCPALLFLGSACVIAKPPPSFAVSFIHKIGIVALVNDTVSIGRKAFYILHGFGGIELLLLLRQSLMFNRDLGIPMGR